MNTTISNALDILELSPVIPVVVLEDTDHAVPVAHALLRGGIRTIEITLRTNVALDAIERITTEVPDVVVGAGTITEPGHAAAAAKAGAAYLITPGATDRLLTEIDDTGLPALPGISTVSEAMHLAERGIHAMKFFPAEASGGIPYLTAINGPLPDLRFCPTGGITPTTAADYLALPHIPCVGGTWLTPPHAIRTGEWDRIEEWARAASALG